MKTETRKHQIRKANFEEWTALYNDLHNPPLVLEYKGKTCMLSAGTSDDISVLRYDKDHFFVLTQNFGLGYAGYELIHIHNMEIVSDMFIQDIQELNFLELKKDFFDYTENSQADILSQWIQ
jgi:hypothetical protein